MGDRLLFKFYKSYFDIASELNDKDRLAFYDALMNKEFYNIEPDLKGMAKFAYISQKHSIDKQVEGWESKMKSQLIDPKQGGIVGGVADPSIQEKEKEKEKEKEEYTETPNPQMGNDIDFNKLLKLINDKTKREFKMINDTVKAKFKARIKDGYTKEDILNTINNASKDPFHIEQNFKYLTPEYFSRASTIDKHSSVSKNESKESKQTNVIPGPWNV